MKKYYFFAALATAGLFAGCSSDESFSDGADARIAPVDENAPAKIEISIADNYEVSTRGTGRVGDATSAANAQWAGQKFNVLMLEKGTMLGARTTPNDPATAIIKGAAFEATGGNVISLDDNAVYYPTLKQDGLTTGVYDFWGYRLDGAETLDGNGDVQFNGYDVAANDASYTWVAYTGSNDATLSGTADPTISTAGAVGDIYENTTSGGKFECTAANPGTTAATQITIPFKIDGTQDVMVASTTPSDNAYATANPAAIFSAKSARNGVKPNLSFKHLLTSITFKVKAKSRDITNAADNPTTDPSWQPGYEITNIQLKSKATGELIVAYTAADEPAERIVWDTNENWADVNTLATFDLQCRMKEVNAKADIQMIQINKTITTNLQYPAGYIDMNGATQFTYTDATTRDAFQVYDVKDLDPTTGLPTGNKTTLGAVTTYGWILTYNSTDRTSYETTKKNYECDYKSTDAGVKSDLVPFATNNVTPVILGWTGYSAGTAEVPVVTVNETSRTTTFGGTVYDGTAANALSLAEYKKTLPVGNGYEYYDGTNYTQFDVTTAYVAATPASEGSAVTSIVGEPMLVAPSNDAANSGYEVIVSYKYYKKTTAATVALTTAQTSPITVNNYQIVGGVKDPGAFEAGKNYNVTITLYSDGEVTSGDSDVTPWEDGGDLEAGDDE